MVTIGRIGGFGGALGSAWMARRFGYGPAMFGAVLAESGIYVLLPAVHGSAAMLAALFGAIFLIRDAGTGIANGLAGTIRHDPARLHPDRLMARVSAAGPRSLASCHPRRHPRHPLSGTYRAARLGRPDRPDRFPEHACDAVNAVIQ